MEDIYLALMKYDSEKIVFTFTDDNSKELIGRISMINSSNEININGIQDQTDIISIFKNINEDILNNIVIRGIKGLTDIICTESKEYCKNEKELIQDKHFILITDGTNLLDVLNNEYVNPETLVH